MNAVVEDPDGSAQVEQQTVLVRDLQKSPEPGLRERLSLSNLRAEPSGQGCSVDITSLRLSRDRREQRYAADTDEAEWACTICESMSGWNHQCVVDSPTPPQPCSIAWMIPQTLPPI